jgi:hypothetical protein
VGNVSRPALSTAPKALPLKKSSSTEDHLIAGRIEHPAVNHFLKVGVRFAAMA